MAATRSRSVPAAVPLRSSGTRSTEQVAARASGQRRDPVSRGTGVGAAGAVALGAGDAVAVAAARWCPPPQPASTAAAVNTC
jgi:hypothetical protein